MLIDVMWSLYDAITASCKMFEERTWRHAYLIARDVGKIYWKQSVSLTKRVLFYSNASSSCPGKYCHGYGSVNGKKPTRPQHWERAMFRNCPWTLREISNSFGRNSFVSKRLDGFICERIWSKNKSEWNIFI